jgi:hypothetical protein
VSPLRPFTLCLAALVVALVAAGCSSPKAVSKAEYQATLQQLGRDLTTDGQQLGKSIDISSFNQAVDNFQKGLRKAAGQLDGLKPPKEARAANKQLAHAFREFADTMEPVKEARRKSIVEARNALARVGASTAVRDGRNAIAQLKQLGYLTGELGSL